ncbi:DUF6354 family protein [Streptomyces lavendulae]|uniref:DUF6354 family protein n=1 Tax=Streptomyces lavendulae TaxID=1914 RepID=UPI0037154939
MITSTVMKDRLYRDHAPDMKARDRRLRVTAVRDGRADLVVEHDPGGQAGRETHASLVRLRSAAFELLQDPADVDPQYLALPAAVAGVHRPGAAPPDYARAGLRGLRGLRTVVPAGDVL